MELSEHLAVLDNDGPSREDVARASLELDGPCSLGILVEGLVFETENELARQACALATR